MRYLFLIILFFVNMVVFSQDTTGLKKATAQLNEALLAKDSVVLKQLIAEGITYGHSNGWLQSKQEIIGDLFSGKLAYKKIEVSEEHFTINKEAIAITSKASVDGVLKGNAFSLNFKVMQVWKKEKKGWVLIARQSVKLM